MADRYDEALQGLQLIEQKINILKERAWAGGVDFNPDLTTVQTAIVPSIDDYVNDLGAIQLRVDSNNTLLLNYTHATPGNFDLTSPAIISEIEITEDVEEDESIPSEGDEGTPEDVPVEVTPEDVPIEVTEPLNELKNALEEAKEELITARADKWKTFVLNLYDYIADFGAIAVRTNNYGIFELTENTNYGLIININEATGVKTYTVENVGVIDLTSTAEIITITQEA